jgi:hypothetical protein
MPARDRLRPLKAWRYIGVYDSELMLCAGVVRVGPARQQFWAVWDRAAGRLRERTVRGRGPVELGYGRLRIDDNAVRVELELAETDGIETVCPSGRSYAWTRKQGGIRAGGTVTIDGRRRRLDARAVIDDTAGYYTRHTIWRWSAGVGTTADGRDTAWNLVDGVNDPPGDSERTLWIDGIAAEVGPVVFAPDLGRVAFPDGAALRFRAEAERDRRDNLLVVRSRYRQPFGNFEGELPGGVQLAEGYGVMEFHDVFW